MADVERLIKTCLMARIPVIATGPPGTGKTGWGLELNKSGFYVIQLIASVREPADIGGWPMRTEKGLVLEPGAWAKEAIVKTEEGERVIIMWDEARTITAPMQAALLKAIHENLAGDTQMPKGITHLAFANSVEDSAGGIPLEPPMANRFAHVQWVLNPRKWVEDMVANKYAPQRVLDPEPMSKLGIERAALAGFINKRSELLLNMPTSEDDRDGAWPSPRTWDYAAHLWAQAGPGDESFREDLLAACVGIPAAGQYVQWKNAADLIDPEDILKGKYKKGKVALVDKDRPDRTYAMLAGAVAAVRAEWEPERYEGAWKAVAHAADEGAGDIAASVVPTLLDVAEGKKDVPVDVVKKYIQPFADLLSRANRTQV